MLRSLCILLALGSAAFAQNLVFNGSFERGPEKDCNFNLSNTDFNQLEPPCTGFGTLNGVGEIDVMNGDCGYGLPAPSGTIKVGIASNGDGEGVDRLSFKLGQPLVTGRTYRLRFRATAYVSDFSPEIGAVFIGLSTSPSDLGAQVGQFLPSGSEWSSFDQLITAPAPSTYLTVSYDGAADGWDHIDAFSLEPMGEDLASNTDGDTLWVDGATPGGVLAVTAHLPSGMHTATLLLIADALGCATASLPLADDLSLDVTDLSSGGWASVDWMDDAHAAQVEPSAVAQPLKAGQLTPPISTPKGKKSFAGPH